MPLSHSLERTLLESASLPSEQEDAHLVQASQQGDQDAFAILVQRHQRRIFTLVFRLLQDDDEASDVTQEVFVAAWQSLPAFCGEARFPNWLSRMAYHGCLRQLERRERTRHAAMQAEQMLSGEGLEKQAEESGERREPQALVSKHLSLLPTRYRMVLILRHLQERTYEDMADILSLPIGTIKTYLFRARNLLKERLLAQHL